jgi:Dual specificity phosphatase, catalytic domain
MKNVFWLKQQKIAGRNGPNRAPWDLEELRNSGISAILSVNNGEDVHETLIAQLGIAYANIPMSSNAPVRTGDKAFCLENLPRAIDFIHKYSKHGSVLVHCSSGKDRTGMVLAAYLIDAEDYNAQAAMDKILGIRPIAFSADGWMDFGLEVLNQFESLQQT